MKRKKIGQIFALAFILIGLLILIRDIIIVKSNGKKYPALSYNDSISNVVVSIFNWEENRCRIASDVVRITTDKGSYSVSAIEVNTGKGAYYVIEYGDSIVKEAKSDTLWVFKIDGERSCLKFIKQ